MTQAITLNTVEKFRALPEEKPCYAELFERIAAIWNAICTWISELFASFFNKPIVNQRDITQRSASAFYHVLNYLEPKEVARCETVCKFWKIPEKIWKARCANYGVTSLPQSGTYKEIGKVPKMAFGPREWVKHGWGEPGPMPSLPADIKSQVAQRKNTHTLTLVPKTVNDQPFSLNTFLSIVSGVAYIEIGSTLEEKDRNAPQEKSLWIWMRKGLEPHTLGITQKDAEERYKLGKTFWIIVSAVADYVQNKTTLFTKLTGSPAATRTCDHLFDDWFLTVGYLSCSKRPDFYISVNNDPDNDVGVAPAFPA